MQAGIRDMMADTPETQLRLAATLALANQTAAAAKLA